jgi:hypothetical protein
MNVEQEKHPLTIFLPVETDVLFVSTRFEEIKADNAQAFANGGQGFPSKGPARDIALALLQAGWSCTEQTAGVDGDGAKAVFTYPGSSESSVDFEHGTMYVNVNNKYWFCLSRLYEFGDGHNWGRQLQGKNWVTDSMLVFIAALEYALKPPVVAKLKQRETT